MMQQNSSATPGEGSTHKVGLLLGLILMACPLMVTAGDRSEINRGNDFYEQGDWNNALASYVQALEQGEDPALPQFNLGDTHYRLKNYEAAENAWRTAFNSEDHELGARAACNIGNARFAAGDLEGALAAYITALQRNPADRRVKYNLEQTLQQLQQQQQQEQESQDQQDQTGEDQQQQDQPPGQQEEESLDSENEDEESQQQSQPDETAEEEQQQPPPGEQQLEQEEITRRQQEQLLQSLEQDEKEILRELMKQELPANRKVEKDW